MLISGGDLSSQDEHKETNSRKRTKRNEQLLRTDTLTIRDQAWLHPNAKDSKVGIPGIGFEKVHFDKIEQILKVANVAYERIQLNNLLPEEVRVNSEFAELFIIPDGVRFITQADDAADVIRQHLESIPHDTQVINHKRLCKRHAQQTTLLVNGLTRNPINGMGSASDFHKVPYMDLIRQTIAAWTGIEAISENVAECNAYLNSTSKPFACGVGFHGDTESKNVCALRFGAPLPLHYQWFKNSLPVGERFKKTLQQGTIYFMSKKAVGYDWHFRSQLTLRHAAGGGKYTPSNKDIYSKRVTKKS